MPNNPQAFPRPFSSDVDPTGAPFGDYAHEIKEQDGMTLRDYFAGKALSGLLASDIQPAGETSDSLNDNLKWANARRKTDTKQYAHMSYSFADAMLAEREKQHA